MAPTCASCLSPMGRICASCSTMWAATCVSCLFPRCTCCFACPPPMLTCSYSIAWLDMVAKLALDEPLVAHACDLLICCPQASMCSCASSIWSMSAPPSSVWHSCSSRLAVHPVPWWPTGMLALLHVLPAPSHSSSRLAWLCIQRFSNCDIHSFPGQFSFL